MPAIHVSTTLEADIWERAKKTGLKWNQLIQLGITAHDNREQAVIQQQREEHTELMNKFNRLAMRLMEYEEEKKKAGGA